MNRDEASTVTAHFTMIFEIGDTLVTGYTKAIDEVTVVLAGYAPDPSHLEAQTLIHVSTDYVRLFEVLDQLFHYWDTLIPVCLIR